MADRYRRVYYSDECFYYVGSNLIVEARALLNDTAMNAVIGQAKIKNISVKSVTAVFVTANLYNAAKEPIGESKHEYLDLSVLRDAEFGQQSRIAISNNNVRFFDIVVDKVVYSDGEVWNNTHAEKVIISKDVRLSDTFSSKATEGFRKKHGNNSQIIPHEYPSLWKCACGAYNLPNEANCHICKNNRIEILADLDEQKLSDYYFEATYNSGCLKQENSTSEDSFKEAARIFESIKEYSDAEKHYKECIQQAEILKKQSIYKEATRLMEINSLSELNNAIELFSSIGDWDDSERRISICKQQIDIINEKNKKAETKRRRLTVGAIVGILAALVLAYAIPNYVLPNLKNLFAYRQANRLVVEGRYDEARDAYLELAGYRDSSDKAIEAIYKKAEAFLDEGKYDDAIAVWEEIKDYSDSSARIDQAIDEKYIVGYQKAYEAMESGDYDEAIALFDGIKEYKDSEELVKECKYRKASALLDESDYAAANKIFADLGDYKDSSEMSDESVYRRANDYMKKDMYLPAIHTLAKIMDYKDTLNLIIECTKKAQSKNDPGYSIKRYRYNPLVHTDEGIQIQITNSADTHTEPHNLMKLTYCYVHVQAGSNYSGSKGLTCIYADDHDAFFVDIGTMSANDAVAISKGHDIYPKKTGTIYVILLDENNKVITSEIRVLK